MSEGQEKKDSAGAGPRQAEKEIPLDTRLLSDAVIELNISRKNVAIYPPGHLQTSRSIDRAYDMLMKLFEIREEMTLGVAKDTLLVGQDYLDRKNPVYRDFALSLHHQGIAAVTFVRGLDRNELVRFHRIITTRPDDIRAAGGIAAVVAGADIPHIRVLPIDYGSLHLTEEEEIFRTRTESADKTGTGLWQDFISLLAGGALESGGQGVALKDSVEIDPVELARLLNERKIDSNAALQSYDRTISEHVRANAEKRQLTREQSETLLKLNDLLKGLHPELRKQFLSAAFENITVRAGAAPEEVLGGFSDDLVIEMLQQASEEGREISPTLTGLLGKLTAIRQKSGQDGQSAPAAEGEAIAPERMSKLFDRESYEEFVVSDYDRMLRDMSDRAGTMGAAGAEQFPVEEHAKSLEDEHLDFQIGRALLAFMEEDIDGEDYREFSKKAGAVMPDLLSSGNFALLLDMLETLRRHEREKPSEPVRAAARDVLPRFGEPEFISRAVEAFDRWSRTRGREAAGFLLAIGPATVPGLMDLFLADESAGGRRIVFDLLCNFGQASVNEALKRLRDPRPHAVRNILILIRWAGSAAVVPAVRPLLQHQDQKVRREALSVLLRFKDPGAAEVLRQELRSKDPDIASQAVSLAGQYRVSAVVDDLLPLFKRVIILEADYATNEEIIRALGEIGDPRAVPDLEKMVKTSWSLYPASLARVKQTIFGSLGRYPRESIAGLLKIGERSTDESIRRVCRKLAERG